jgi:myo-inositol-1(or 4)-monophosphatase
LQVADLHALSGAIQDLALLREAAREAGQIAMRYFGKSQEVWMKGGVSPVGEADYAADKFLRETLLKARPDYGWLSEETADDLVRLTARRTFVVDPIDGTRGFLEGGRTWCVSVAVVEEGRTLAGVLECPAKDETYWSTSGGGAFLNGRPIRVREAAPVMEVAGPKPLLNLIPSSWQHRLKRVPYIPSLAYRLAMIAAGRLDGTFVKANAHDWDIAAADLILREAGGKLLDRDGRPPRFAGETIKHGPLAAGSGELLTMLSRVIGALEA